jgi:multidrug efflux pump subunit AcrB
VRDSLSHIASLRDLQMSPALDYPAIQVNVDRQRAGIMGITAQEVARSTVAATSSSRFVTPNYWADPKSGIAYQVQVEIPVARMNSVDELRNLPVSGKSGASMLLRDVATVDTATTPGEYDRYNMQRTVTLNANLSGEDLGSVARQVSAALAKAGAPPAKVSVTVRGQIAPMEEMLSGLRAGFVLAVAAIFLMLAGYFQSVRLGIAVLSTIPAVVAGVAVALWATATSLNIQSFMGAIMAVGVAVANAILLVAFAERDRLAGMASAEAAADSAQSRLRPILMTSFAMIAGMLPMALGLGEGGDQTAPLGRAVIGGLAAATLATLFALPAVFALLMGRAPARSASLDPTDPESPLFEPPTTARPTAPAVSPEI